VLQARCSKNHSVPEHPINFTVSVQELRNGTRAGEAMRRETSHELMRGQSAANAAGVQLCRRVEMRDVGAHARANRSDGPCSYGLANHRPVCLVAGSPEASKAFIHGDGGAGCYVPA
jgi:hypothetical protein